MKQISILLIVAMMLTLLASCTVGKYEESNSEASSVVSLAESEVASNDEDPVAESSSEQSWVEISTEEESVEESIDISDVEINYNVNAYSEYFIGLDFYEAKLTDTKIFEQIFDGTDVMQQMARKYYEAVGVDLKDFDDDALYKYAVRDNIYTLFIIESSGITKEAFAEQNEKNIREYAIAVKNDEVYKFRNILYTDEEIGLLFCGDVERIKKAFAYPETLVAGGSVYTHFYLFNEKAISRDDLRKLNEEVDLVTYLERVKAYYKKAEDQWNIPYDYRYDHYNRVCELIEWLNGERSSFPAMPTRPRL